MQLKGLTTNQLLLRISVLKKGGGLTFPEGNFNAFIMNLYILQRPHKANLEEMTKYHSDDYVKFLKTIRPDNMTEYTKQMQRCE